MLRDKMWNAPGLVMPQRIPMQRCLGVGYYAQASTHVQKLCITTQTAENWETQIHSDSFLFPSPEGEKHTPVYVCFSIFLLPFSSFLKSPGPLALILPLSFSAVGMEADGSWHDGGFVLTIELMWPRGCRPCMPGLMAHNAKCFIVERGWERPKTMRKKRGKNSCVWR